MNRALVLVLLLSFATFSAVAQDKPTKEKDINEYLVDITSGAVSALGIIDAKDMAVSTVETSQDLVLALNPLVSSSGGAKKSFGLAFTPARSTVTPMSGNYYATGGAFARMLGAATVSYAQNEADYASVKYRKMAVSLSTLLYFHDQDDPIYAASEEFSRCAKLPSVIKQKEDALIADRSAGRVTETEFKDKFAALTEDRQTELNKCIDSDKGKLALARWNAPRMTASVGYGRIEPNSGPGGSLSLGKSANVNLLFPMGAAGTRLGDKGSVQVSLRYSRDAVDTATLAATPTFKNSSLAAVRLTYGDQEASAIRVMAEASTARNSQAEAFKEAFMYAVGIDKKLMPGLWFEFRLGRNRSVVDGKEQTTGMVSFNFQPTKALYKS